MESTDVNADGPVSPVVLPEVLDVRAAAPLAAELLVRRGRDVDVDASGVRRLGGQCLQVLLAAHACWAEERLAFRVVSPSNAFIDGLTLLGASTLAPAPADRRQS